MALSLGDLFPLRGSRRAASLAAACPAGSSSRRRSRAAPRPTALAFETYEPRMLLSADVLNNVTLADYVANPTVGSAVLADLTSALNLLDNVASAAQGDAAFDPFLDKAIPGLLERETKRDGSPIFAAADYYAPTLRDVLEDNGADPVAFTDFLADTLDDLSFVAGGTGASLNTAIGGLGWSAGGVTVTIDTGSFALVPTGGSNYEYRFDIDFIIEILDTADSANLDLGRNADGAELAYGAAASPFTPVTTSVPVKSTYRVDAQLVGKASIVEDTYDHDGDGGEENPTPELPRVTITANGGVLRDPTYAAGVSADTTLGAFGASANNQLTFGFLDISAGAADIDLLMAVEADFSGDFSSNAGLVGYDLAGHVEAAANSHVTITLPVSVVDIAGYPAFANSIDDATAQVVLSAPTPFDAVFQPVTTPEAGDPEDPRTSLQVELQGFADLEPFRNIDAPSLANVVAGLANMLEQLQSKAELFGSSLPFLDGKKISNLLDFDGPVKALFEAITREENGARIAKFSTVQGFVTELVTALGSFGVTVNSIAPTFTTDRASGIPTLLFRLNMSPPAANQNLDVDGDLGVGLGPLGDVAVSGSLTVETTFNVDVTLGIELADDPIVQVGSVAGPFAVTALDAPTLTIGGDGARLRILVGGNSSDSDDLSGGGSIAVTIAAGTYTDTGLRDALRTGIQAALVGAGLDASAVQVALAGGRLVLSSASLPVLQVVDADPVGVDEFGKLGFETGQRATTSRLPANGVLSAAATFSLTLGGQTHAISVAPDAGNETFTDGALDVAASVAKLAAEVELAINTAFGTSGVDYVRVIGDVVSGLRLVIDDGNAASQNFVRIDGTNAVASGELGFVNDAIASRLAVRGESGLAFGPNASGDAIPADASFADFSFDVKLFSNGASVQVTVNVDGGNFNTTPNDPEAEARAVATAVNDALQATVLDLATGQTLGSVLAAGAVPFFDGSGNVTGWGVRLVQPATSIDNALPYGIADRIEVSGATNEHIGLADAGFDRVGPAVGDPLGATAAFTINLINSSGAVTQFAVSIADSNQTLSQVVDAINTQIAGGPVAGQVMAGLDGTRLVIAVASGSATTLTLTNVNAAAAADLGLAEGISARALSGIDAFVQDVNLRASIAADGAAQGEANFGFVALSLGEATVEIDAVVDMDFAVGESGAIFLPEFYKALQHSTYEQDGDVNPLGILGLLDGPDAGTNALGLVDPDTGSEPNAATAGEEVDVYGSAKLRWEGADITIAGSGDIVDDLNDALGDAAGDPFIQVVIPNLTDLDPGTFQITYDLGGIADAISNLANFGFEDALAALRAIAGWLQDYVESLGILNDELPLLGISLADSLEFVQDFAQAVEDIATNPTKNLQGLLDKVNEGLSEFAGAVATLGYAASSPGILTFGIAFQRQFADNLPLNIDVVQLLTDAGVPLDALPDGALELSGQADLAAAFGIDASIKFGIDVDALSAALDEPVQVLADIQDAIFLDADETYLELSAFAAAENVTFTGSLGPLGLFVTNGGAVLNADGVFGNDTPATVRVSLPTTGIGADDRITLGEFVANIDEILSADNVDFQLALAAELPIFFPTSSNFIGSLAFSGELTDPFDLANGVSFELTSLPDFSQIDLGDLGILDSLSLFLAGADSVLGTLGDLINGQLFGGDGLEDLPLVGDALQDVGSFIEDLRNEVIPAITGIIDGAPEIAAGIFNDVGNAIHSALTSISVLAGSTVSLNLVDGDGNLTTFHFGTDTFDQTWIDRVLAARAFSFGLDLAVDIDISTPHADLGLDVFSLEFEPLTVSIDLDLSFGMGVSLDDGFFFEVNAQGDEDFSAEIAVLLPESIKAELFLLQLEAFDNTPSGLEGHFSVDVKNTDDFGDTGRIYFGDLGNLEFDVDYGIDVQLDLLLELGLNEDLIGSFGFPKITAEFDFEWHFGDDPGESTNPELTLDDIRLDIGSFLGETIGPFIRDVYDVIEPIDPILDILTNPIPVLSDLLGPTSLLDVAAQFGVVNPALVTALELLDQLVDFASTVDEAGNGFVDIMMDPISFGGNDLDLTDMTQVGGLIDPGKALNSVFAAFGATPPQEIQDALDFITSGINQDALTGAVGGAQGGFSFPFLDHPEEVLGLFFGRNMTLVAYDLPPLEFGFDFSIYVPIWGPLGARFAGGIGAIIDLAFGYDTQGFFSFADGDFRNPLDLVDGFFVYDDNPFSGVPGIDVPEVTVTGEITAAAELNAMVASAGVGGGIFATIGFDLNDPDQDMRIRLDEILANLYLALEEGPLALFSVDALIEAKLFAYIEALFGLWRKEFQFGPSLPLYEEHFALEPDPVLATDLGNGTLRLNIGDYAEDRVYTTNGADDPSDVAETIEVEIVDADTIRVRGKGADFDNGSGGFLDWQTYNTDFAGGFQLILGKAGQGDDSVTILDPNHLKVRAELRGGSGNDALTGADGDDLLEGDTGDDHLVGGAGKDSINGGAGADCVEGGEGDDLLAGGSANDMVVGGEGDDVLLGEDGDDVLVGGAGADTALGGAGRDLISGGVGADVLLGNEGIDRIWGDADFTLSGCDLVLDASLDEPALVIPAIGDHGADRISGGGGSDEIQGNGGDDLIHGDSSFKLDDDFALVLDGGQPVLLLPSFGDFGADNLSGGAGNDTIFGEAGNDVIRGDNTRVIASAHDDDNVLTWFEGDRFSRGTAQADGAADGDDTLHGGKGSDIVFGNAGNDTITGGTENDILLGNAGDDTVRGELGADAIFGDSGTIQVYVAGDTVVGGTYAAATQDFKLLQAESEAGDGDDWLDGAQDADILFGGGGVGSGGIEDEIRGGGGDDVAYGDHGQIDFSYVLAARASFATTLTSIDKDFGGDDLMFGSTGRDVLVGGKGDDTVNGDDAFNPDDPDSRDILAGDHVVMTQEVLVVKINGTTSDVLADIHVVFPEQVKSNETDPTQGGDDVLDGRQDDDFVVGGPGDDRGTGGLGNDVLVGDRGQIDFDLSFVDATDADFADNFGRADLFVLQTVQSTDLALADVPFTGIDRLSGGDGNDVVIGGGRGDFLFGDAELDGSIGALTDKSDILLGDNGIVQYAQHGTLASIRTLDVLEATGGDDEIEGNAGVDIAMGGVGGDIVHGDAETPGAALDGDDILLGDNGELDFSQDLDLALNLTGASPANLATLDLIRSFTDGIGGVDVLSGDWGGDVVMGGTAGDIIYGDNVAANSGNADLRDLLLGDNGTILLVDSLLDAVIGGADRFVVRGGAIALIRSTDEDDAVDDTGGSDAISGNAGGDIMLGGVRGDLLWGDREVPTAMSNPIDGGDIILGDNGALEWLSTGRLDELSFDPADPRWNAALPIAFATRNADLDTLDVITTEQPNNGGRDLIFGGNARDTAMGGTDADTIWGDTGPDALLSLGNVDAAANGNDLLFGDHGRLYAQLSVLDNIHSRNFFTIDIGQADGGEGDRIWGEEGMDILLGQQGDDRLWGGSEDDDLIGGHNVEGGADELAVTTIAVDTGGRPWNDLMDGGTDNDVLAGDNAIVWRTGDEISPRFRTLTGGTLYTTTEATVTVNVDGTARQDPDDTRGRFTFLLDHADGTASGLYGDDVMAGGAQRDALFGQLGDDLMQGDGMIDTVVPAGGVSVTLTVTDSVGAPPGETGGTVYFRVPEQSSDGDDYMEGNGGNDDMLGGLGQDDMIGGSSALFGLATAAMRPDGSDFMWGGAGIQTARGDLGHLQVSLTGTDPAGTLPETAIAAERGRDADHMLGDNGNIFRIVSLATAAPAGETNYRRYQYDNAGYTGANPLVVRASEWLDYTLGGPDYDQDQAAGGVQTTQGDDNGAGDYMHGEAGNDHVHGMAGADILFGDAHDDDIVGGYGHDWISGGTGQDGAIGDDGIIRTSRNSTTGESLYGVAGLLAADPNTRESNGNVLNETITTPGNIQVAVINKAGELTKAMDLTPLSVDSLWSAVDDEFGYAGQSAQGGAPYADDIIYGGTGSDWLHGGSGDDGISGAEALAYFYTRAMLGMPSPGTLGGSSVNVGDQLGFNPEDVDGSGPNRERAGEFALYDEYFPLDEIRVSNTDGWGTAAERVRPVLADGTANPAFAAATPFFLNFDANDGVLRPSETVPTNGNNTIVTGTVRDDGDDRIFGDNGNDWLVGGTGRDNVYGGWGNDLLNVDDRHTTNNSRNDQPDTHSTYEDRAYGGAGRDVLVGNTGGDRLIDWVGEWNSYLVPFAPFGMATVSRTLQPQLPEFLYALSRADGADPTIVADGNGSALRNGEPFGELGLVLQKDTAWQDQTGAPADPQAGNIPGGKRDVLRSADFNNQQGQGFVAESGSWTISAGKYEVAPSAASGNKDAISLYFTGEPLPLYFEIAATINAIKPVAGFKANAYIIFDYVSPTDFKFAGLNVSTNKIEIGQRASWGFQALATVNAQLKADTDYNVLLAVNGNAVTFQVNGAQSVSHAFAPRVDAIGITHPIRDGMYGLGGDNARARIDDVRLQILPPNIAYAATDDFAQPPSLLEPTAGGWTMHDGRLVGAPAGDDPIALAENTIAVDANATLQVEARFSLATGTSIGGIVFDKYSDTDYKFAAVSAATGQVLVGHYSASTGWVVDAAVAVAGVTTGVDYHLGVTLKGSTVNVTFNGVSVLSRAYNATVVDGAVGFVAKAGAVSFDSFGLKTDDAGAATASTSAYVEAAPVATADPLPVIDWAAWNASILADSSLVNATGDVLWQEQFVSRLGMRSKPGGLNSSLYFRL